MNDFTLIHAGGETPRKHLLSVCRRFGLARMSWMRAARWALLLVGCGGIAWPAEQNVTLARPVSEYNLDASKLAIQGYDPVAYQALGQAVKGLKTIEASHQGVTYRFATESHRDLFTKNPDRYLPAYGGWCATAMVKGEKVEIDPRNFKVTDGRLFLFFKAFYADARKEWVKNEPVNIQKADLQWGKIVAKQDTAKPSP